MTGRTCEFCGEPIGNVSNEMWFVKRNGRNSNMMKCVLHPECFDKVWGRANMGDNAERISDEDVADLEKMMGQPVRQAV